MKAIKNVMQTFSDSDLKKRCNQKFGSLAFVIFRAVLIFSLCFVILYPVIYMVSVAIRQTSDLYDPTVIWIPKHFTAENFYSVIEVMDYWKLLGNTMLYSVICTLLSVISCSFAGYGFARFNFKLKMPLFVLMLFMIIVPPQIVSIPLYLQYNKFDFFGISVLIEKITGISTYVNLLNTPFTLFVPAAFGNGLRSGLLIYMFRQFFRNMPTSLEDAAYIDGCGTFKTFFRIIMPNASGSFLVGFLLSFVWYYNDYFFTTMYFAESPTLSVALASLKDNLTSNALVDVRSNPYALVTQLQAGCLLVIIPLLILFIFLQKYFIKSISSSGIVG